MDEGSDDEEERRKKFKKQKNEEEKERNAQNDEDYLKLSVLVRKKVQFINYISKISRKTNAKDILFAGRRL